MLGIIGTCFMIYIYKSPDTTVKTARHVATSASDILFRATQQRKQFIEKLQREYINKETGILNKEERSYLSSLYGKNEEFREEFINFVRDKEN